MHRKAFMRNSVVLLLFVLFKNSDSQSSSSIIPTTAASTVSTTTGSTTTTTKYAYNPYKYGGYKKNYGYGDGYGGYGGSDGYYDDYKQTGTGGIDPRKFGQDVGDFGPIYDKQHQSMSGSLDVFISSADDWEQKDPKYRGRGRGGYGGNKKYDKYGRDDDNKRDGYRKKRSNSRVRFPVRHFPNIREFPIDRFPPLLSIFPWLPIFYDERSYQTFIFSPTGGIYIIPPLINFYGQRFAVAQLIKWGYASLVASGAPPPPNVNIAPLVAPPPAGGAIAAGVVGSPPAGPPPTYDANRARFNGGVKTEFPNFKPQYAQTMNEGGSNYGPDRSYGGTRNQEVYAQGGGYRN